MSTQPKELSSLANALFYGHIHEDDVFPFPALSEEQKATATAMTEAITKYAESSIDPAKLDQESLIPDKIYQDLGEMGLMGIMTPEEFGGLGLDTALFAKITSVIAQKDSSITTMLGAHQSIGYRALLLYGSDQQRQKYLPRLASGKLIAAFCLTEPGAGSDAYSITTKAVDNGDGTYSISGQKLWITNGGKADFYTVFCKTEHQIKGQLKEKISCFIVEKGTAGLSFGKREKKMGIRASETRAVFFDQVKVPAQNMIGEAGKGFKIAMNVLNSGRLSLGAGCVGAMQSTIKLTIKHASERKQFKQKLTSFGIIQDKLSQMSANVYAAESLLYYTIGRISAGQKDYSLESAICKIFCSERLWETVDTSLQIAGGMGYMQEYPYERLMRDSRINLIFEGTNEILRVFIALSGMRGPGEALKDLGRITNNTTQALLDPIKSVGILTHFAKRRIDKMMSKTLSQSHPAIEKHANNFSRMLGRFAIEVENTLIKYGSKIIGNELPQKRIADMTISLFTTICIISRTSHILHDQNIEETMKEHIQDLTDISCQRLYHSFMQAYKENSAKLDQQIARVTQRLEDYQCHRPDITDY